MLAEDAALAERPVRGCDVRQRKDVAHHGASSAEFMRLWDQHNVEETTRGLMRVSHPLVGELSLDWDAYPMPGAPGPVLIVCTVPEGSPDARRLQRLAALLAEPDPAADANRVRPREQSTPGR